MPFQQKRWGCQFWKNNTASGAQQEAINSLPNQHVLIASQTQKEGRMWGHCSPEHLLKVLETNKGIFEILHSFPKKVYFDFDEKESPDFVSHIQLTKQKILKYFPDADMAISGSNEGKASLHIIVNNYLIKNIEEQDCMKLIAKELGADIAVYTINRLMKSINQSKLDGRVQSILETNDYKKHIITSFFDISLQFPYIERIQREVMIKRPFNLSSLPKMVLKTDADYTKLDAMTILELLPISKEFKHPYTHLVARFCFYNGLSFETFYSWYSHKNSDNQQKWRQHWGQIHTFKFGEVSIDKMKIILCSFYPKLKQDIHFRKFAETFNIPTVNPIETITQDCFNVSQKCILFNVGMGGGKTSQTIDYLTDNFCWIAPNIALSNNTCFRFNELNKPISHYSKKDFESDALMCCLNSIFKIKRNFDIIVIDEIETVIDKLMGDFLENKYGVFECLKRLLSQAKKIIVLDAFITTKTTNFLNHFCKSEQNKEGDMIIYTRKYEPQTRTIVYMKNQYTQLNDMVEKIKNGAKVFCFFPYKKDNCMHTSLEKLNAYIIEKTGKKGIFYNADVDDGVKQGLKNINDTWKDLDYVLTNNVITCGVNYENLDFDYKYIFIGPMNTPRDIIQVSYRARHLSTGIIKVCFIKGFHTNTYQKDYEGPLKNDKLFTDLYDSIITEKFAPLRKSFQLFCKYAHYKTTTDPDIISDELATQIENTLSAYNIGFSYDSIELISFSQCHEIQDKCLNQDATQYEKNQLEKYFLLDRFNDDKYINVIWGTYNNTCKQVKKFVEDKDSVFHKIIKLNGSLFPNIDKMKINDDIKDDIFKQFKFKFITRDSGIKKIYQEVYNLFFKFPLFKSIVEKGNTTYFWDDPFLMIFPWVMDNMKITPKFENLQNFSDDETESGQDPDLYL
jgi:hypothetical protein